MIFSPSSLWERTSEVGYEHDNYTSAWTIFGAQNGVCGFLQASGVEVNDILTITPTNCDVSQSHH